MKRKSITHTLILSSLFFCLGISFMRQTTDKDVLIFDNIEALAASETFTTWSCDGTNKRECCVNCGVCKSHVHGTGKLTGYHTCN